MASAETASAQLVYRFRAIAIAPMGDPVDFGVPVHSDNTFGINDAGHIVGYGFDEDDQVFILTCPADLDGDFRINGTDLGLLFLEWGESGHPYDLDCVGTIDGNDTGQLLLAWTGSALCTVNEPCEESFGGGGNSELDEAVTTLGYETVVELVADLQTMSDEEAHGVITYLLIILED